MTSKNAFQIIRKAYEATVKRHTSDWRPIASTKLQLEYCLAAVLKQNDRSRLNEMMFYQYAVHEFESSDPAYAELLHEAAHVVNLMIKKEV